jgi:hypothetical protein
LTTQSVNITLGNAMMSKVFENTGATDGQWTGNTLTDTIAGQQLGILVPAAPLNWGQLQYEAGACAYRIQDAQSLQVSAVGFGAKSTESAYQPQPLERPITVRPNDIVSVYPLAASGAGTSAALAWVYTSKGRELFAAVGIPNATATEIKSAVNTQSLGDMFFGSRLNGLCVQVEDGHKLTNAQIVDEMGGVVMTLQGSQRSQHAGQSNVFNLEVQGLNIAIGKGWKLNFTTTDA